MSECFIEFSHDAHFITSLVVPGYSNQQQPRFAALIVISELLFLVQESSGRSENGLRLLRDEQLEKNEYEDPKHDDQQIFSSFKSRISSRVFSFSYSFELTISYIAARFSYRFSGRSSSRLAGVAPYYIPTRILNSFATISSPYTLQRERASKETTTDDTESRHDCAGAERSPLGRSSRFGLFECSTSNCCVSVECLIFFFGLFYNSSSLSFVLSSKLFSARPKSHPFGHFKNINLRPHTSASQPTISAVSQ